MYNLLRGSGANMEKYRVDEDTINKEYGILKTLTNNNCLKNIGAITNNKYLYEVGITSYEGKKYELERTIGDYNFEINIFKLEEEHLVIIKYIERDNISKVNEFQYNTLIDILRECKESKKPLEILFGNIENILPDIKNRISSDEIDDVISGLELYKPIGEPIDKKYIKEFKNKQY